MDSKRKSQAEMARDRLIELANKRYNAAMVGESGSLSDCVVNSIPDHPFTAYDLTFSLRANHSASFKDIEDELRTLKNNEAIFEIEHKLANQRSIFCVADYPDRESRCEQENTIETCCSVLSETPRDPIALCFQFGENRRFYVQFLRHLRNPANGYKMLATNIWGKA